ncbi:MAG: hypothetical protein D3922_12575 [Candidatus Electrothrix sp. AR1]|nr:hypothetical protein [Candidatus Electrothrix sp. AR1]
MVKSAPRANCTICVPFDNAKYTYFAECPKGYRDKFNAVIERYPELFPPEIQNGYQLKDSYISKKLNIRIRRIKIAGRSYTVRPSFVMPYMTAFTDDAEKALFLSKFDVPAWGIARIFGKNGPIGSEGAGRLPSAHRTVRTGPYTAPHVTLIH